MFVCVVVAIAFLVRSVQTRREAQAAQAATEVAEAARRSAAAATERERRTAAEALQKQAEQAVALARRRTEQAQQKKLAQDAAAEHERFLTRYVNTNFTKAAGKQTVAVAVASDTDTMNHAIGAALVTHLQADPLQLTDSFFKPELVTDGLFAQAFNGATELFNKLELTKFVGALVLAKQDVEYETKPGLNNVVTAVMKLEIITLPVTGQSASQSWTLHANGAGIRRADARAQAEERILKQIATDSKLTLTNRP